MWCGFDFEIFDDVFGEIYVFGFVCDFVEVVGEIYVEVGGENGVFDEFFEFMGVG